jgi:transposase
MFADVSTFSPVIDRLRRRFDIARVCVVADRGMISAETVAELEARRLLYILGVRERSKQARLRALGAQQRSERTRRVQRLKHAVN